MKRFKIIIVVVLMMFLQQKLFSQMMISAKVEGKETAKKSIDAEPLKIDVKKSDYKDICSFDLIVKENNASSAYKKTIELTDAGGSRLYASDESKDAPGVYKIDLSSICERVSSQEIIKIILLQNPADDKMALPSKMTELAEIHLK